MIMTLEAAADQARERVGKMSDKERADLLAKAKAIMHSHDKPDTVPLPCPFCGGYPEVLRGAVECDDCGIFIMGFDRDSSVAKWNRRAKI